jgi:hypothetical protein
MSLFIRDNSAVIASSTRVNSVFFLISDKLKTKVFTQPVISWVSWRYSDHGIPESISAVPDLLYNLATKLRTPKGPKQNPENLEMEGNDLQCDIQVFIQFIAKASNVPSEMPLLLFVSSFENKSVI